MAFYGYTGNRSLSDYRLAAKYSSGRAFEETADAVSNLSQALEKSLYAADAPMRAVLCAEISANALAAETAMATLPFSTHELERLSEFLNVTGDYACYLASVSEEDFDSRTLERLSYLSGRAADFSDELAQIREELNNGDLSFDSREKRMANVESSEAGLLSGRMLEYEESFGENEDFEYGGKYTKRGIEAAGELSEEEMKELAAEYAGVSPDSLELEYEYEGTSGRKCYSVDDTVVCVSPRGMESMGQSRLVSEIRIELEEAEKRAKEYLKARGYENLELGSITENGAVALMLFSKTQDGAVYPDNYVKIGIAMDDGSVYSFNAEHFDAESEEAEWKIEQAEAEKTLPSNLQLQDSRRVVLESEDGKEHACYELSCLSESGREVKIYVDAADGKQRDIRVG